MKCQFARKFGMCTHPICLLEYINFGSIASLFFTYTTSNAMPMFSFSIAQQQQNQQIACVPQALLVTRRHTTCSSKCSSYRQNDSIEYISNNKKRTNNKPILLFNRQSVDGDAVRYAYHHHPTPGTEMENKM